MSAPKYGRELEERLAAEAAETQAREIAHRGSLEERAAALEALTLQPATAEMTDEQVREFEKNFAQIVTQPWQPQVPSPRPPLTQDEVRHLLRECVTVVKPGETLIVRVGPEWTPMQMREMQESLNWGWGTEDGLPFRTLVIPGEELGVAEPFTPIAPLPMAEPPDQSRPAPRRFEYPLVNLPPLSEDRALIAAVADEVERRQLGRQHASGAGGHE